MLRRTSGFTLTEMLIALAVAVVLFAMAFTAYQDHLRRASLAEALGFAADARTAVENYYGMTRHLPIDNNAAGLAPPTAYRSDAIKTLTVAVSGGKGIIELVLNNQVQDNANVKQVLDVTERGSFRWRCLADSTIQRLMPTAC